MSDTERSFSEAVFQALSRGVEFLRERQLPHGEFATYVGWDPSLENGCSLDSSPFVTTFVLHALSFVNWTDLAQTRGRALAYLLEERESGGLWRFWTSGGPNHWRAPPDLDDTSCVSWTLRQHGVSFGSNEEMLYANRNTDGLFYTYIRPLAQKKTWLELLRHKSWHELLSRYTWAELMHFKNDVDIVVNANVVLYLGEHERTRNACRYIVSVIERGAEEQATAFYVEPLVIHYMVSRAYYYGISSFQGATKIMPRRIGEHQQNDGSFGTALATAIAACSLLNCGLSTDQGLERAVRHLTQTQDADGSWKRAAFFAGPRRVFWWGSEELTTAFCVEALARYQRRDSP
jgi:hypothetical protein